MIIVNTVQTLVVLGFSFSLMLIVGGMVGRYGDMRLKNISAVPVVFGFLFGVGLIAVYLDEVRGSYEYLTYSTDRSVIGLATLFMGLLSTEFLFRVAVPWVLNKAGFRRSARMPLIMKRQITWWDATIGVIVILAFPAMVLFGRTLGLAAAGTALETEAEADATIEASYPLPGAPTDLVMVSSSTGYVTLIEGQVVLFELPKSPDDEFKTTVVARDLVRPHGITIVDGSLYVTEQGVSPCPQLTPKQLCHMNDFKSMGKVEAEVHILSTWRGSVIAFDITSDGRLENRMVILKDIPVVNSEHAVNGIQNGNDGWLYLSVGGYDVPEGYVEQPETYLLADIPRLEMVGTIVRFRPDGSEVEIFTRGIRNIFGIAVAEDGTLFGVDNDGQSGRGDYRAEEIVVIEQGKDHGWPYDGTYSQNSRRTGFPIGVIDTIGSAGVEWAGYAGLEPGLLIGSLSRVDHVLMAKDGDGYFTVRRVPRTLIDELPASYITGIAAVGPGKLLVSSYGLGLEGSANGLLLLDMN